MAEYPDFIKTTGYGTGEGLCGWNCRHLFHAFVEGVTERTYTDEELANIDPPPFEYQGKEYTFYEATQKQRQIETALRKVKREAIGAKASGDNERYTDKAARYKRLTDEYHDFCKAAGLREQLERSNVAGFGVMETKELLKALKNA